MDLHSSHSLDEADDNHNLKVRKKKSDKVYWIGCTENLNRHIPAAAFPADYLFFRIHIRSCSHLLKPVVKFLTSGNACFSSHNVMSKGCT